MFVYRIAGGQNREYYQECPGFSRYDWATFYLS